MTDSPSANAAALIQLGVERAERGERLQTVRPDAQQLQSAFASEEAFRRQLMAALMVRARDEMLEISQRRAAGAARVHAAISAYLDAQLKRPALRELMLQIRETAGGQAYIRRQIAGFAILIAAELRAMGRPHPEVAARLLVAGIVEAANMEFEHGGRLEAARELILRPFAET